MKNRYCVRRGALVSARGYIPTTDWERWFGGPVIGCSNLVCSRCQAVVRQQPKCKLTRPRVEPAALYPLADWSGVTKRTSQGRLYTCTCHTHVSMDDHPLDNEGRDLMASEIPWACGGHADVPQRLTLDGQSIHVTGDLTNILRQVLNGELTAPRGVWDHETWWLDRLMDAWPQRAEELGAAVVAAFHATEDLAVTRRCLDLFIHRPALTPIDGAEERYRHLDQLVDPLLDERKLSEPYAQAVGLLALADPEAALAEARALKAAGATGYPMGRID